jgi:hypothetical protein
VCFSLQEAQVYSFSANHAKGSVILTEHESAYLIIRFFFKRHLNAIGTIFCIKKSNYISLKKAIIFHFRLSLLCPQLVVLLKLHSTNNSTPSVSFYFSPVSLKMN